MRLNHSSRETRSRILTHSSQETPLQVVYTVVMATCEKHYDFVWLLFLT